MTSRPYIEPDECGVLRRCWHEFSARLERIRRHYGLVCCLLCVFTATGIVLADVLHGWPWDVFMLSYTVMLVLWVGMSILLLLRAAARGVLSWIMAKRPEPPAPRRIGAMGTHAMPWEVREDNPPDRWQRN